MQMSGTIVRANGSVLEWSRDPDEPFKVSITLNDQPWSPAIPLNEMLDTGEGYKD